MAPCAPSIFVPIHTPPSPPPPPPSPSPSPLLSFADSERDNLVFVMLPIDQTIAVVDGMRPFMLPVFFYGGQISKALENYTSDVAQVRVLSRRG